LSLHWQNWQYWKKSTALWTRVSNWDITAVVLKTRKQIQSLHLQLQQLSPPRLTNGTIFQLSINNAGAVSITRINGLPRLHQRSKFRIQGMMPSPESGFLAGNAKLKFDAYPFQDYGVVAGHLRWSSHQTSKVVETPQGKVETFWTRNRTRLKPSIQTKNKHVALTLGVQTERTAEVIRSSRRLDWLLNPSKKLQKGWSGTY